MTDNHYGTIFKYGTSHKYGASSTGQTEALAWGIEVDWDGDGSFDGDNEADHLLRTPSIKRGRRTMLRPSGQGFESVRTGQAVVMLSNHDGRYDAWNTSSPIYPNVEAGKDIRIRVLDKYTGIVYKRFYGVIQEIEPYGYGSEAYVVITADDAMRTLRDTYTTAQRPYTDGTLAPAGIDECIGALLDKMQWPTRWSRNIDSSSYGVRYWYASGDRNVATELEDLALNFFGYCFITADGKFRFIDKTNNRTSVETISQSLMLKDIGNPQPWSIRRNVVKLRFHVRSSANSIVWQPLDSDPALDPGETREYFVEYTDNGYPAYLENIVSQFRYSTNPYVVEVGSPSGTAVVTDYGNRAFISINNPNAVPIYVYVAHSQDALFPNNNTYIKGDITWTEKAESISNPRDPATVTNQRTLVLDSEWYQNKSQAYDFVDNYQAFISVAHKTPIIQMENRFALQFTPDLFDVITVDIPYLGLSNVDLRVGAIEEDDGGSNLTQKVKTKFYLEPFLTPTTGTGVWGTGKWGVTKWSW